MGMIARVKQFLRGENSVGAKVNEAVVDPGGGANLTAEVFQPVGDDAQPLGTDYAILLEFLRTGSVGVVGYADPLNAHVSGPGEKRIYSRDSAGAIKAEVYLKKNGVIEAKNANGTIKIFSDGQIKVSNANGSIDIVDAGDITINDDIEIDTSGNINMTGNITTTGDIECADMTATGTITGDTVFDGTIELGTHQHVSGPDGGPTTGPI